jgi:hypothetical protein
VPAQPGAGTVPLYRYFNGALTDHCYTTNWGELGYGRYGWELEGIQCQVYPQPQVVPAPGRPGASPDVAGAPAPPVAAAVVPRPSSFGARAQSPRADAAPPVTFRTSAAPPGSVTIVVQR